MELYGDAPLLNLWSLTWSTRFWANDLKLVYRLHNSITPYISFLYNSKKKNTGKVRRAIFWVMERLDMESPNWDLNCQKVCGYYQIRKLNFPNQ